MLFTLVSTLSLILGIYIVITQSLNAKIKKKASAIAFLSLILLFIIIYFTFPESISTDIFAVSGILIGIAICILTTKGCSKSQIVYIAFLFLGLTATIGTITQWVSSIIFGTSINFRIIDLLANLTFLIFCAISARKGVLAKIFTSIIQLQVSMKIMLIISLWVSALLASLFSYFLTTYFDTPAFIVMGMFSMLLIILLGIMCPLLIVNNLSSLHFKNLSTLMEKQVETQLEHYEAMTKMYENIRRFKHDYNNLFIGLNEALKRDDAAGALSLLNAEEMALSDSVCPVETGCVTLDALLNEKQISASKVNASLTFDGIMPGDLLNPVDICIIFGNALDNAVEACAKLKYEEEKIIAIASSYKNGFLFIKIENPSAVDVRITNNAVSTTKSDKNSHGIGLRSIKTAVEKHFGEMTFSYKDGVFCLEINLDFNMQAEL